MLQLANILYSRGFSITIIHTCFNSPNYSNYNFTFHSIPDGLSESEASTVDLLTLLNVNCVTPFRDCLAKLLSDSFEEPIACMITDAIWHFTQAVADSCKLPRIVFRTSSVSSFLAFGSLVLMQEKGYLPIQESLLEAPWTDRAPLQFKDIPLINARNPEDFYRVLSCMLKNTRISSGLIWNSLEELEQSELISFGQDFPNPMFPIGPLNRYFPSSSSSLPTQDRSCLSWLNTQPPRSVLYASFGSLEAFNRSQFEEIVWGRASQQQAILPVGGPTWVSPWLRVGRSISHWVEAINGRGHIVKWAPQQEVLAHPAIGGFCSQNGWNSTLERVYVKGFP